MTNLIELKEEMTRIEKIAVKNLVDDTTIIPLAFVKDAIVVMNTKNEKEKFMKYDILKKIIKEKNSDSVITINLAWMASGNNCDYTKTGFVMPSKNPNRKEVILLNGECSEGNVSYAIEFNRIGRKITISDKKVNLCDCMNMSSPSGIYNFGIRR